MSARCDECGRFTKTLVDVPSAWPYGGIDHRACESCATDSAEVPA